MDKTIFHRNIVGEGRYAADLYVRDPKMDDDARQKVWAFIANETRDKTPVYATAIAANVNYTDSSPPGTRNAGILETYDVIGYGWMTNLQNGSIEPCLHIHKRFSGYGWIYLRDVLTLISISEIPF